MKFSSVVLSLAALAVASVSAIDTNESGLETLGERSHELKARHRQANSAPEMMEKRDWFSPHGKLTWYAGYMLNDPACGGPRPGDNDMVLAVEKGGGYGKCGDKVRLHYKGRVVEATIRDYCDTCSWGHFDATKGVFSKLAPLQKGVLEGVHFVLVDDKKKKNKY